jgi:hypothetical protein
MTFHTPPSDTDTFPQVNASTLATNKLERNRVSFTATRTAAEESLRDCRRLNGQSSIENAGTSKYSLTVFVLSGRAVISELIDPDRGQTRWTSYSVCR